MSQNEKPAKKIVSRGEYVRVQLERVATLIGRVAFRFMLPILGITQCCFLAKNLFITPNISLNLSLFILFWIVMLPILGAGIWVFFTMDGKLAKHAAEIDNVVPLTKAMASNVPAQESLVRASSEPSVAAETVLLRAADYNSTTPPEQLVRSSDAPA